MTSAPPALDQSDSGPDPRITGLGLGFVGGLALSFDIPLIRLAISDPFMVMVARGLGLALVLGIIWLTVGRQIMPKKLLADRDFVLVGTLSGLNNVFFTMAVFNTTTANVVFILAFNAMIAAILSWWMLGERPGLHTILAIIATLIGVVIIVSGSLGFGNWIGDLFSMVCAVLLAFSLTITRRSGKNLSLSPGFGGLVSGLFAAPIALVLSPWPEAPIWLAIDALVMVPLAGITLWLAPKFIPAPHVALFYLLETVLAPVWVYFVFTEKPNPETIIGGSLILIAMIVHTIMDIRLNRKRRRYMR